MAPAVALKLEKTPPLYERAYERLQAQILAGELPAGQRLLDTRLAVALGVSRTPIRDALRRLVHDRLVETDAAGHFYVARPSREVFMEFCACRELLEPEAAAMAARKATRSDLAALAASLSRSSDALRSGDLVAATRSTVEFHSVLASASHNRLLAELIVFLRQPVAPLRGVIFGDPSGAAATDREHRAIYEAVAARDPDAAAETARAHIRGDRERGLRVLDRLARQVSAAARPSGDAGVPLHGIDKGAL